MFKSSILVYISLTVSFLSYSQIPNNGFEDWSQMEGYENPIGWATLNDQTKMASIYTATKGTPGNVGSAYLKLTSRKIGDLVTKGIAVSGKLDTNTLQPISGFAFEGQPRNLIGKWQFMGMSPGSISIALTKWNAILNKRDTVAFTERNLAGMVMSWKSFSIPLEYRSSTLPDSCIIFLQSSGSDPSNNDYLWVDELSFDGSVAGLKSEGMISQQIKLFPNPSKGEFTISSNQSFGKDVTIQITTIEGKIVKSEKMKTSPIDNAYILDLQNFGKGVYVLKLVNEKTVFVERIEIE